jgi:hypothetical protein
VADPVRQVKLAVAHHAEQPSEKAAAAAKDKFIKKLLFIFP